MKVCEHPAHPLDVLCSHCGQILINDPSPEQLEYAERLAKIRSLLPIPRSDTAKRDWQDLAKSYVPVVVTLLVAIGGWWITSSHNAAQVQLKNTEQQTTRAASEATASLAYLQFLARYPPPTEEQQDQALVAVAAVLPPELAFSLAVKRLPAAPTAANLLIRTHGDKSWKYLSPLIEENYDSTAKPTAEEPSAESTAKPILKLLHDQNLLQRELDYLLSAANDRPHRRLEALVSYFKFLDALDREGFADVYELSTKALVYRLLKDERSDPSTRSDVAAAAAFAFVDEPGYEPQWDFLSAAAETYWDKFDVALGALPAEKSIRFQLFHEKFHFVDGEKLFSTPAARIASKALGNRLVSLDLRAISVDRISGLLYTYAGYLAGPRGQFTPYLAPNDIPRVVQAMLLATDTPAERYKLSQRLGGFDGQMIYENLATDKAMQYRYAELVVDWYAEHADALWAASTYFPCVAQEHPALKARIAGVMKKTGPLIVNPARRPANGRCV